MIKLRPEFVERLTTFIKVNAPKNYDELDRQQLLRYIVQNFEWAVNGFQHFSACGILLVPERTDPFRLSSVLYLEFRLGAREIRVAADPLLDFDFSKKVKA